MGRRNKEKTRRKGVQKDGKEEEKMRKEEKVGSDEEAG